MRLVGAYKKLQLVVSGEKDEQRQWFDHERPEMQLLPALRAEVVYFDSAGPPAPRRS